MECLPQALKVTSLAQGAARGRTSGGRPRIEPQNETVDTAVTKLERGRDRVMCICQC